MCVIFCDAGTYSQRSMDGNSLASVNPNLVSRVHNWLDNVVVPGVQPGSQPSTSRTAAGSTSARREQLRRKRPPSVKGSKWAIRK
jgi:hypothetical protein